jgi:hypothetical protein
MSENQSQNNSMPSLGGNAGEAIQQEQNDIAELESTNEQIRDEIAKKWKLQYRANDQDVEEELDENTLKQRLALAAGAQKHMSEAAQLKKEAMQMLQLMKTDPRMALMNLSFNGDTKQAREFFEKELASYIQEEMLSPEEKARRQEQEELRRYREQEKAYKQEMERRAYMAQKQENAQRLESDIIKAIEVHNLPRDPEVKTQILMDALKYLAGDRANAMRNGTKPTITADEAVKRARDSYDRSLKTLLSKYSDDDLYEYLGPDVIKKIRAADLRRVKKAPGVPNSSSGDSIAKMAPKSQTQKDANKPLNEKEFREMLRNRK